VAANPPNPEPTTTILGTTCSPLCRHLPFVHTHFVYRDHPLAFRHEWQCKAMPIQNWLENLDLAVPAMLGFQQNADWLANADGIAG